MGQRPKVIIAGAGLGGVMLGILLDLAGVHFDIYEKSAIVQPLGLAIALGCNVCPIFKQIGIWDEFLENSKPVLDMNISNSQRETILKHDFRSQDEVGGSLVYATAWPILYDMLLRRIPAARLHFGKRVVSIVQGENGVIVRTADGKSYEGDILVGADGCYSAVRQSIYEKLQKNNKLPAHDIAPMLFRDIAVVGQTYRLNPEDFPELLEDESRFEYVVGKNGFGCSSLTTNANTICWVGFQSLDKETSKENDPFRNSEFGPEAAEKMCKDIKDVPFVGGNGKLTLGNLIELSPKRLIKKVVIGEKLFKTWYSDRTVLLGDAVSRMHPAGAMGASSAIQDAVALANWINILPGDASMSEVIDVFKEYKAERYPSMQERFQISSSLGHIRASSCQGKMARALLGGLPKWMKEKYANTTIVCRPQVSFLPLVEDKGTIKTAPQPSLEKTLLILKKRKEANKETVAV
ncbi:hypothetical protein BG006_003770 [Podila minutissima]|uniref:FAD-binding domain-containing protein n=1 Tax=Podila minutissima TaxID=64525 RepID=A0A9P5SR32_9FUNG|nr:hypothetical protein BG006_003770 [Podila minutissima]